MSGGTRYENCVLGEIEGVDSNCSMKRLNVTGRIPTTRWSGRRLPGLAVALLISSLLAGCAASTRANPAPNATATPTTATAPTPFSLTSDCPQTARPPIEPGASLTLHPNRGPVGTHIDVAVTGLQPGCHLWLGLTVEPCTCETGGTVEPAPHETSGALQWVTVDDAGAVRGTVCLCGVLYSYTLGYPPYPSVTPPARPGGNTQAYSPRTGDHFYITMAGATIGDPPPLYALFSVTG
jgi:hypothetical protein